MKSWLKSILPAVALLIVSGCAAGGSNPSSGINSRLDLGDVESENRHNVRTEDTEVAEENYPDLWINALRASGYERGHEPWRVIDGDEDSYWAVSGEPQHPIRGGHWIDLEHNRSREMDEISIRWLGDKPYNFKIIRQPWSDATSLHTVYEGKSSGQPGELENYRLSETARTRAIRIEFATEENDELRGIKEVHIGGLSRPESYPPAAYSGEQVVEKIRRPFYVEFQRFMEYWPQFNLKRPLADGATGRRLLATDEFEGGFIEFDIEVDPEKMNWITLEIWESRSDSTAEPGIPIALEAFIDDPDRNRQWFMPEFVTDQQKLDYEWYGRKPQPGRWVYAHYKLTEDVVGDKDLVRLRLQGIGNDLRDRPMRGSAPPVYSITSHSDPAFIR